MTKLVGIAGSLRRHSFNRALLSTAAELTPESVALEILPIDQVPLYNGDVEKSSGLPEPVKSMNRAIEGAAGLVIVTPEYNMSIPGVMKNIIDWLSRPDGDRPHVLRDKPVALLGATPGGMGTISSQAAWLSVLRTLRMRLWVGNGPFYVSSAGQLIEDGVIVDAGLKQRLADYIAAFAEHVRASP